MTYTVDEISEVVGSLSIDRGLAGVVASITDAEGIAGFYELGFYEILINQVNSYFQDIADVNGLIVRYDNDIRETPSDALWCECNLDFGNCNQSELGIPSFRNIGNLNIKIKNKIGLGTSELLQTADTIADAFRSKSLNRIVFNTPRIRNIGRVGDDHQVNVICPFFTDKVGR